MKALVSILVLFGLMGLKAHAEGEMPADTNNASMSEADQREPAKAHHKKAKKKKHAKKHKTN